MPLESGFGIELTMLIRANAEWHHVYTYYNHGLEPPYGGVRSEETGEDLVVKVEMFDKIMGWTNDWIRFIKGITKNPITHNPDLPLEYRLYFAGENDVVMDNEDIVIGEGDVVLRVTMETLDSEFIWSKDTGMVNFKARPAYDLSWEGYLFYVKCMEDFSDKVKEQL